MQELETVSDDAHKEGEGEIVPQEDGGQAQGQNPPEKKGRTRVREIPDEELVLRLYHEHDDRDSRDKERAGVYRDLQKRFAEGASPGQRARWEQIQHDPRFRECEVPDEELVQRVVGKEEQDFPMGSSKSARWTEDGILLVHNPGHENESIERVIEGRVNPLARLLVDDEIYHRWAVGEREVTAKLDTILDKLHGEGAIVSRRNASDVLSTVASGMIRTTEKRHATYGVYPEGDKLALCEDPLPVEVEQASAWEQVKEHVRRSATPEEVQAYTDMLAYWRPYEVLPAIGLGFAAPFTPVLRQAHIFVPHLFHYAPEHDLGKSAVALMTSWHLYGIGEISGEGIGSQYRFAAHLDSIALPLTVDEAGKLQERLLPIVKDSAERWTGAERGTKELGMVHYHSRAVFIMTGNTPPTENAAVLKRTLMVHFDSSAQRERRKKAELVKAGLEALKPIGFAAVKRYVVAHPNRAELLKRIVRYAREIEKAYKDWESAQRPQAWAVVYLGLKVLEEFCQAVGVKWAAPSIEAFVEQVVEPVERSTWESRRTAVDGVEAWFDMWCAKNATKVIEGRETWYEVRGKDEIWKDGAMNIGDQTLEGVWLTDAMLGEYNKQAQPGERIPSLIELARQAADAAGIPYDQVLESDGKRVKSMWFGGRSRRVAFVPFSSAYRGPKHGDLVRDFEPVGQEIPHHDLTTSPQDGEEREGDLTKPHQTSPCMVMNQEDILADEKSTLPHHLTMISTRARKEPEPLSADPVSTEHLPPKELGENGYPPEISRKLALLREKFQPCLVDWAIHRALEMRERGDGWTAYHLRSEGRDKFPDLPNEVELLADEFFLELDAIAGYLHACKKAGSSSSCTTSASSTLRGRTLD